MLSFRATSSRVKDEHGTNFFTVLKDRAVQWAQKEAKDGYTSQVYEVGEVLFKEFKPEKLE